jgi:nucleotide-binding universal stress UspA family protein
MREIRKILVPTDFSAHAEAAAEWAVDLAEKFGAEVTLVHVYDYPTYVLPDGALLPAADVIGNLMADIQDRFDRLKAKFAERGVALRTETRQGVPLPEIVKLARESGTDLIVMGTHGRTGIQHFLIGSVAEKVVRKAPCPVLTVRLPGFGFEHPGQG